jgi:ribosomal-protein-alanine N-acetyltransferase
MLFDFAIYLYSMERLNLPEEVITERLLLQRLRYEDAEEIFYAYASKAEATRYVTWPAHNSIKTTREYVRYAKRAWNEGLDYSYTIRLRKTSQLIGSYGVINENGRVQFGYILSPTFWNQGIATEACMAVTSLLKTKAQIHRIGTFVDCDNMASAKVLEKCGYKMEATLQRWLCFPNQENKAKDCWVYVLPTNPVDRGKG